MPDQADKNDSEKIPVELVPASFIEDIAAVFRLSKYHGTDSTYKPDKTVETALLESGNLTSLKANHSL